MVGLVCWMAVADDSWPLTAYLKYLLVNLPGSFIVECLKELGYIIATIIGKTSKTCLDFTETVEQYKFIRAALL